MLFNLDFKDMLLALSGAKINFLLVAGRPKDIADADTLDATD